MILFGAEFLFIPPFDYVSLGLACPAEAVLPGLDGTERKPMIRTSRNPAAAAGLPPYLSVIVPVRNEARFLQRTLEELLAQDYPHDRFEVLVADGESSDATPALVRALETRHDNLRLLRNPRLWSSAGRNQGIRAAQGELIVVVDGHCELGNPSYLATWPTPSPAAVPTASAGRSRSTLPARPRFSERLPRRGRPAWGTIPSRSSIRRRSSSCGRRAWRSPIAARCSTGLVCSTNRSTPARTWNSIIASIAPDCAASFAAGAGTLSAANQLGGPVQADGSLWPGPDAVAAQTPRNFYRRRLPARDVRGGLGGGPAPAPLSPILAMTYAAIVGTYVVAIIGTSIALSIRARMARLLPWLPLVFAAIHTGAGIGILREWAFGTRQTVNQKLPLANTRAGGLS